MTEGRWSPYPDWDYKAFIFNVTFRQRLVFNFVDQDDFTTFRCDLIHEKQTVESLNITLSDQLEYTSNVQLKCYTPYWIFCVKVPNVRPLVLEHLSGT